jgi:hypothetical protein
MVLREMPSCSASKRLGGKLRARCQTTGFDGAAQLIVQLARQVLAAVDDNM